MLCRKIDFDFNYIFYSRSNGIESRLLVDSQNNHTFYLLNFHTVMITIRLYESMMMMIIISNNLSPTVGVELDAQVSATHTPGEEKW